LLGMPRSMPTFFLPLLIHRRANVIIVCELPFLEQLGTLVNGRGLVSPRKSYALEQRLTACSILPRRSHQNLGPRRTREGAKRSRNRCRSGLDLIPRQYPAKTLVRPQLACPGAHGSTPGMSPSPDGPNLLGLGLVRPYVLTITPAGP
jgi:hypothetical protein